MSYIAMQFPQRPNTKLAKNAGAIEIRRGIKQMKFVYIVERKRMSIYISFPSIGGVRIRNSNAGHFEPQELLDIRYSQRDNGDLLMTGKDTSVLFRNDEKQWSLEVYGADGVLRQSVTSTNLRYGHSGECVFYSTNLTLPMEKDERLFGFGERFNSLCQKDIRLLMWNLDCCDESGGVSSLVNDFGVKTQAYKNVPLVHSNKGYSLFFNTYYTVDFDIGVRERDRLYIQIYSMQFDLYIWTGTPEQNLQAYLRLTGTPYLPPKWAFEYWAGGGWPCWNMPDTSGAVGRVRDVLDQYEKCGIPISLMFLEVNPSEELFELLRERGVRVMFWTDSRLLPYEDKGYAYRDIRVKKASDPQQCISGEYIDYSNPASEDALWEKYGDVWEKGLRGIMIDYADCMPEDAILYNGKTGSEMHNGYGLEYSRRVNGVFRKRFGDDFMLFQRCGCAGSQHFAGAFGGDMPQNFLGLQRSLWAMLSCSASGFSVWGSDIGGYFPKQYFPEPMPDLNEEELYIRWMQFGVFSPLMRNHGMTLHEPWMYTGTALSVFQQFYALRLSLLDKIYSTAIDCHLNGSTIVKSMAVAENDSPENESQYLFCDDFLVCPITEQGKRSVHVHFREDGWRNLYDGAAYSAGSHVVDAPLERLPVFIRPGAAIPVTVDAETLLPTLSREGVCSALVVTAPTETRVSHCYTDTEHMTAYTASPCSDGFTLTADGTAAAPDILIFHGAFVNTVTSDAEVLSCERDALHHRTVVKLAKPWKQLTVTLDGRN